MTNAKEIHMILGIIGTVISSLITLAPMPKFIEIYKKKSVEDYKPHRHITMMMKCSLWILYGIPLIHKDNILVTTANSISFGIEVIYLVIYYIYCHDEFRRSNIRFDLSLEFTFVAFFYLVTLFAFPNDGNPNDARARRHILIGGICIYVTIIMHTRFAWQTMEDNKSFQYMSFGFSFVSFINATSWTAYSLIYQIDIYVLISNGLGMLECASQFIVNAMGQEVQVHPSISEI